MPFDFEDLGTLLVVLMFVIVPILQGLARKLAGNRPQAETRERRAAPRGPEREAGEPDVEREGEVVWRELLQGLGVETEERKPEPEPPAPVAPPPVPVPVAASAAPDLRAPEVSEDFAAFESVDLKGLSESAMDGHPELPTEMGDLGDLGQLGELEEAGEAEERAAAAAGVAFAVPQSAGDWRHAVLLSEIFGPPVAARPPGAGSPPGLSF